jgi:hypothetical protein
VVRQNGAKGVIAQFRRRDSFRTPHMLPALTADPAYKCLRR